MPNVCPTLSLPDAKSLGTFQSPWTPYLRLTGRTLERISGLQRCRSIYAELSARSPAGGDFVERALQTLGVDTPWTPADLERIPESGPLIVVANHPFGAIEGLVLAALLRRRRPDVKILANYLLKSLPELGELLIPVDPFRRQDSSRRNVQPMRAGLRWLKQGGVLLVFPAGEVSHLQLARREITDSPWSLSLARMVRSSGAPVLPIHVPGRNGLLFQLAGLIHPRLRTALLPRELLNKCNQSLPVRIGSLIPAARLGAIEQDRQLVEYLRLRTYLLGEAAAPAAARSSDSRTGVPGEPAEGLAAEIAALPPEQLLVESGAYRCGRSDRILSEQGVAGLYTSTLFKYRRELLDQIGPALEMGRSFVRPEYQKSYAPLLLLWKGIGHFVVRHPQYRILFGPVSISRDYSDLSRQLIAGSLQQAMLLPELARQVQPRMPLPLRPLKLKGCDRQLAQSLLGDIEEVSVLVGELELEQTGIPVLLRHYLNLGGRFLAFNRDPEFSDALDGLVLVDLTRTERKTLDRYMTRSGAQAFLHRHRGEGAEAGRRCA